MVSFEVFKFCFEVLKQVFVRACFFREVGREQEEARVVFEEGFCLGLFSEGAVDKVLMEVMFFEESVENGVGFSFSRGVVCAAVADEERDASECVPAGDDFLVRGRLFALVSCVEEFFFYAREESVFFFDEVIFPLEVSVFADFVEFREFLEF